MAICTGSAVTTGVGEESDVTDERVMADPDVECDGVN
jgi:hypothetical protein